MSILIQQYNLVRSSRAVMLDFIENEVGSDVHKPLSEFNDKNLFYLLVHTANTYKHWLANFALDSFLPFADDKLINELSAVRLLYEEADTLTRDFLDQFHNNMDAQITNVTRQGKTVTATPLALFTHAITHEFHHKGQLMSMCRLLGHTPPDTDVIRF